VSREEIKNIDPLIHAPVRLAVLSILAAVQQADFSYLKKTADATDGNLSRHLSKLEDAGYISIKKTFEGKKPRTFCSITKKGREMFMAYLDNLQKIIDKQKGDV